MKRVISSESEMKIFGKIVGQLLTGGEFIELVGDVGAGKTTFTKGLAVGMGIDETIQSPTFTISRTYDTPSDIKLAHYDFYRLHDAGIMIMELAEARDDAQTVVVIEWADAVSDVMPQDRVTIQFESTSESERTVTIRAGGVRAQSIMEKLA